MLWGMGDVCVGMKSGVSWQKDTIGISTKISHYVLGTIMLYHSLEVQSFDLASKTAESPE